MQVRDTARSKADCGFRGTTVRHRAGWGIFAILLVAVLSIGSISVWNALRWRGKTFPGFLLNHRMAVGIIGQPEWTGIKAGLKYPEEVVSANGRPLKNDEDLEGVLRESPPGTAVSYEIERDGIRRVVVVPTMRFSDGDLFLTFGVIFLQAIVYVILALVVFFLKPNTETSWVFLVTCLIQSLSDMSSFDIESTHFGFIRVYLGLNALLPAAVLHLAMIFPEPLAFAARRSYLKYLPYAFSILIAIPLVFLYPRPLSVSIFRLVLLLINLSVACIVASAAVSFYRRTSVLARQRAKIVLIGVAAALPVTAFVSLAASMGIRVGGLTLLTNLTAIPMLAFPVAIGYAIARHNLFDVDQFVKRAVGYAIMTAIVGGAYFGLQVGLEALILEPIFGSGARLLAPILFALLVVFLFNPLSRWVQGGVDRIFFRKTFDYKETVLTVSNALASVLNPEEIIRKIINTIRQEMFVDKSAIVVMEPRMPVSRALIVSDSPATEREKVDVICIPKDDQLLSLISRERTLITRYDVEEDSRYLRERESCKERFAELGASMVMPMIYQDEVKAILAVGNKKSGLFFTREDVDLLQTLASHGAVAMENAHMAEQMKREEMVRTNLSRYLSPQIVDRIVRHNVQVNLGGDRRVVTVLFSDVRNFTTITESRPPDQLVAILNEYFTEMAKIIFDHQGSLDKYIGDAVVAVFGSLIAVENPATNAVAAALEMMERMPELNRDWEAKYGFSMNIGIGISTGEVFLGNIGSPERMEFTVIGDTVNVASRFSGLAKSGQILVTKETLGQIGEDFQIREHPRAEVKGKRGKVEVFEVMYLQPAT